MNMPADYWNEERRADESGLRARLTRHVAASLAGSRIAIGPATQPGKVLLRRLVGGGYEQGEFDAHALAQVLVEGRSVAAFFAKHF